MVLNKAGVPLEAMPDGLIVYRTHPDFNELVTVCRASPEIADRLVACWNVCMGVSTSTLKGNVNAGKTVLGTVEAAEAAQAALHKIAHEPFGHAEASHQEVLAAITTFARDFLSRTPGQHG